MKSTARRTLSVLALLVFWEVAVRFGLVSTFVLVAPSTIVAEVISLVKSGELLTNINASMVRVLSGYLIALVTGVVLGAMMGWFRWLDDIVDPIVELLRPVSPLAILPLTILWLGIGQSSKIFVIWYACFFPILLNTYSGVRGIPKSMVEAGRTLGAQTDELLRKVVLNHSLPMILTGARISFAVGMIVIIAAEMVAADTGLGFMILTAQQTFRTSELYAGIVTIAAIGFLGDRILRMARSKLSPWYVENE